MDYFCIHIGFFKMLHYSIFIFCLPSFLPSFEMSLPMQPGWPGALNPPDSISCVLTGITGVYHLSFLAVSLIFAPEARASPCPIPDQMNTYLMSSKLELERQNITAPESPSCVFPHYFSIPFPQEMAPVLSLLLCFSVWDVSCVHAPKYTVCFCIFLNCIKTGLYFTYSVVFLSEYSDILRFVQLYANSCNSFIFML
jgi:hypothetical protein